MSTELELPSNRKFGAFWSAVFLLTAAYFLYIESPIIPYFLFGFAVLFLAITLFNSDLLLSLNKLWMGFGTLIGKVVSPVVMAAIFFGLITPYSVVMRMVGRDALRLRRTADDSNWIRRPQGSPQTDFKQQF